jgi:hypothetical protein
MDNDTSKRLKVFVTILREPLGQLFFERTVMHHPTDQLAGQRRAFQNLGFKTSCQFRWPL